MLEEFVKELNDLTMQVFMWAMGGVSACAVVVGLPLLVWFVCIRVPLPGTLSRRGDFETEDPADPKQFEERKRDFARIVENALWLFTPDSMKVGVRLPIDVVHAGSNPQETYKDFREWLQGELRKIPGATWESGRTLGWVVIDRVVNLVSASPGVEFLMRHKVNLQSMESKWLLIISYSGQVRVAWYTYVADKPRPGQKTGELVVRLISEDLNRDRIDTWATYHYSTYRVRRPSIAQVIADDVPGLCRCIASDDWNQWCRDEL